MEPASEFAAESEAPWLSSTMRPAGFASSMRPGGFDRMAFLIHYKKVVGWATIRR